MKKAFIFVLTMILLLGLLGCDSSTSNLENEEEKVEAEVVEIEVKEEKILDDAEEEYGIKIFEDRVSFMDGREEEISLKKNAERVVVIYNSFLEIWMSNGGSVVGIIEPSVGQDPIEGIEDAQLVGKLGSISAEKVLDLEPDLVILISSQTGQMELVPILEENSIPLIAMEYYGKDDYFKLARLFSALTEREDLFEKNVLEVEARLEEIIEKAPKEEDLKVLLMMASAKSVSARDSTSTVGEMLADLNTINIADHSGDMLNNTNFSIEKIIEEDPDFIFVQTTGSDMDSVMDRLKEDVEDNPAWSSLTAVKNERYIILPKDLYMFKPNHKYDQAYLGLAEILYPEIYGN